MIRNWAIWPMLGVFSLLPNELAFICLFVTTAAGVVPCGGPKMFPRTSFIVQTIFTFDPLRAMGII